MSNLCSDVCLFCKKTHVICGCHTFKKTYVVLQKFLNACFAYLTCVFSMEMTYVGFRRRMSFLHGNTLKKTYVAGCQNGPVPTTTTTTTTTTRYRKRSGSHRRPSFLKRPGRRTSFSGPAAETEEKTDVAKERTSRGGRRENQEKTDVATSVRNSWTSRRALRTLQFPVRTTRRP